MKISRIIIILVVIVVVIIIALFAYEALTVSTSTTTSSSTWFSAANYPVQVDGVFGVAGQQCVNSTRYIYCIGGQDTNGGPQSEIYSSSVLSSSSSNISSWTADSNVYPQNINGQSCVVYSNYVYCVGGTYNDGGDDVASSYYAPLSGNGTIGSWNSTTPYPIAIDTQYCVASSGYIYCVGGNNETDGTNADATPSDSVWYATLSSSGIGTWSHSSAYPNLFFPSCFASSGYIYCLGGTDVNNNVVNTVYYAALSSTGVGAWTGTTAYPNKLDGQSCVISSGYIYCVGGQENSQNVYQCGVLRADIIFGYRGLEKSS